MSAGVGCLPSTVSFSCFYLGNRRYSRLQQRCGDRLQFTIFLAHLCCTCSCFNVHLRRWFQPIWKILVKLDHFPNFQVKTVKNKKQNAWNHHLVIHPSIHPSSYPHPIPPKRSQKESKGGAEALGDGREDGQHHAYPVEFGGSGLWSCGRISSKITLKRGS